MIYESQMHSGGVLLDGTIRVQIRSPVLSNRDAERAAGPCGALELCFSDRSFAQWAIDSKCRYNWL